jgi:hypothetical protein
MLEERIPAALADDAPRPVSVGWGWREIAGAAVFIVVATIILAFLARFILATLGAQAGTSFASPSLFLLATGIYLASIAGVYLFAARRAGWAALGLRPFSVQAAAQIPLVFILGLSSLILVNLLLTRALGSFDNPQVEALTGGSALSPLQLTMLLLLVAGLVPFAEELFFRGMLYPVLRARFGPVVAIVLNAAIFAGIHVFPLLLPGLFVVGLALAYLRERSGSLWPSVIYHVMQNAIALLSIAAAMAGS